MLSRLHAAKITELIPGAIAVNAVIENKATLTVERRDQTYRIHPNGSVEGDGALRAQLETIVADGT
jgi:hypothetical protein